MEATKRRSDEATKGRTQYLRAGAVSISSPSSLRRSVAPSLPRRGFSFAEVMFAVVILGIGFIMVAAIFPVAIKQTQASVEESFTAAMSRNGTNYMEQFGNGAYRGNNTNFTPALVPQLSNLFATDLLINTQSLNDQRYIPPRAVAAVEPGQIPQVDTPGSHFARGRLLAMGDLRVFNSDDPAEYYPLRSRQLLEGYSNAIVPTDPRYAFVPLYRRDRAYNCRESIGASQIDAAPFVAEDSSIAQLVLFGVQVRNRTEYQAKDLPKVPSNVAAVPLTQYKHGNLEPRPVAVRVGRIRDLVPAVAGSVADPDTYIAIFASVVGLDGDEPRGGYPTGSPALDTVLNNGPNFVAEGSFFVISDDRIVKYPQTDALSAKNAGIMNGRIYRVGVERTDLGVVGAWELYPGYDFVPDPGNNGVFDNASTPVDQRDDIIAIGVSVPNFVGTINGQTVASNIQVDGTPNGEGAVAFVMGRALADSYIDSTAPNTPLAFDGTAMDVSVYTTMIKVK